MKRHSLLFILSCLLCLISNVSHAGINSLVLKEADKKSTETKKEMSDAEYQVLLKARYQQHQNLIPKVSVANMFYACNKIRKSDPIGYRLKDLILKMNKNQLAMKLSECLGDDEIKSNTALNFGLVGCFTDQFSDLSPEEKKLKMALVSTAIKNLTREERVQSFAKCVEDQSLSYL
jgi:hypothetical protein